MNLQNYFVSLRVILITWFIPTLCYAYNLSSLHSQRLYAHRSQNGICKRDEVGTFQQHRKTFLENIFHSPILSLTCASIISYPESVSAGNLPKSNGADLSKSSTIDALVPIIKMKTSLLNAQSMLFHNGEIIMSNDMLKLEKNSDSIQRLPNYTSSQLKIISETITNELSSTIPFNNEVAFKKIIDEYSDPVSYKQKFMDQNAFLVYYTKGFDGVNRPSLESDPSIPKQTLQYGYRNDIWVAMNDMEDELIFVRETGGDDSSAVNILHSLEKALIAFDQYLSLVPLLDLETAHNLASK